MRLRGAAGRFILAAMTTSAANADFAVVGGGVIGLACAWELARGGARVVLLERGQIGREASHAAGGMLAPACESAVHPWPCAPEARDTMLQQCFASRDAYPDFAVRLHQQTGHDIELCLRRSPFPDWREPGILFVAPRPDDPRLAALLAQGEAATWNGQSAVLLPDDGQVDNRKLAQALGAAALGAGVWLRENFQARSLKIEANRVVGVVGDGEEVRAGQTLLCSGAWSGKIAALPPELLALSAVRPLAGQMVQLRGDKRLNRVLYSDDCYLIPRRDGRLLVGATVEEVGYTKRVTAGGVGRLLHAACEMAPQLRDAPLESHWAGLRPATRDGLPVLGATSLPGLWAATGHGRNGILLAPATAHLIARALLDGAPLPDAFSPARFAPPA